MRRLAALVGILLWAPVCTAVAQTTAQLCAVAKQQGNTAFVRAHCSAATSGAGGAAGGAARTAKRPAPFEEATKASNADAVGYGDRDLKAKDYADAIRWYRLGADRGYAPAQSKLGDMYDQGEGVPVDDGGQPTQKVRDESQRLFQLAADQGDAEGEYQVGMRYYWASDSYGRPTDAATVTGEGSAEVEAMRWFRLAAAQNSVDAEDTLGNIYASALFKSVPQDYAQAAHWYQLSADQGGSYGQYELGELYAKGQGVPLDLAQARVWMTKAAAQDNSQAQEWLADDAKGVNDRNAGELAYSAHNYAAAVMYFGAAADHSDPYGEYMLGLLYATGQGAEQNVAEARSWMSRAAAAGDQNAKAWLAFPTTSVDPEWTKDVTWEPYNLMFDLAQTPSQSADAFADQSYQAKVYQNAIKWYLLAAGRGDAYAEDKLAHMYLDGVGVVQDLAQARQLMTKAAAGGNDDAKSWLSQNPG